MSDKIVELKLPTREPNQKVIRAIEDMLAEAKSGRVRSVYLIGAEANGGVLRFFSCEERNMQIIAGLAIAMQLLIENVEIESIDISDDPDAS
jgi:hypothetical protein